MVAAWQKARSHPQPASSRGRSTRRCSARAAPALSKYDDDQKKADDEKKKTEEAKRKADEESKARTAATAPTTAPAGATSTSMPSGGSFDGTYGGSITQTISSNMSPTSATTIWQSPAPAARVLQRTLPAARPRYRFGRRQRVTFPETAQFLTAVAAGYNRRSGPDLRWQDADSHLTLVVEALLGR